MAGKIIGAGGMGFVFMARGMFPPQLAAMQEEAQVAWATGIFSVTAIALPFVKETEIRPAKIGFNGNFIEEAPNVACPHCGKKPGDS